MAAVVSTGLNISFGAAQAVALGDTVTGNLQSNGSWHYFRVSTTTATAVELTLSAPGTYPGAAFYGSVFDSSFMQMAATNLGGGSSLSTRYAVALPGAGTYYLGVRTSDIHSTDTYTLAVAASTRPVADFEREPGNTPATATPAAVGRQMFGQLLSGSDKDLYSFSVAAAGRFQVTFAAEQASSYEAFKFSIVDGAGRTLAQASTGQASSLSALLGTGTYYLQVERGVGHSGATYGIQVDPFSSTAAAPLAQGGLLQDSVAAGQARTYTVDMAAGSAHLFSLAPASGQRLSITLLDPSGAQVDQVSRTPGYLTYDAGSPAMGVVAPSTGTYQVVVRGLEGGGAYTLRETPTTLNTLAQALLTRNVAATPMAYFTNPAPGAPLVLSFAFMDAPAGSVPGFQALSDAHKQVVRNVLVDGIAPFVNIVFVETADNPAAQLRFGFGDLRGYGADSPTGAGAMASVLSSQADRSYKQVGVFLSTVPSTDGRSPAAKLLDGSDLGVLVHEIGHALGLKHPGDYGGNGADRPFLPSGWDDRDFTSMSYLSGQASAARTDTLSLLDIVALQQLYGAPPAPVGGPFSFSVSSSAAATRSAPIGRPGDAIDASNQALPAIISLAAGTLSSIGVNSAGAPAHDNVLVPPGSRYTVAVGGSGGNQIYGNDLGNLLQGGAGNDTIIAGAGNDRIVSGGGNDQVDGRSGLDTLVLASARSGAAVTVSATGVSISMTSGVVLASAVERLQFTDRGVALDLSGNAGSVARVIGAVFGAQYVADRSITGLALAYMDAVSSEAQLAAAAVGSSLFAQLAGGRSNTAFVNAVYKNVTGALPGAADLAYYTGLLDAGTFSQASLAAVASQVALNSVNINLVGLAQTGIDYSL